MVMSRAFQGLAVLWVILVESFFLWASFKDGGFIEGIGRYLGAHINPLIFIYYIPGLFFLGLSGSFEKRP
jgi:hypothetical protein